ncbi:TetR/AcrR family transcriptional regulator [Metabacillus fastidiosus]|uniref:TetR/AcrR family transcriptional regulator n=1 Tax=Metabacillus fastidiosus TaxID=1458 RepID=UPI002DB8097A|nr:TetR/AcrR family transcriptional regulator [Metabacillus fastidiosus]MEC2075280.1 TetR/AcrR family transcriptional regulator [Metabacillus fastidiosus]
MAKPNIIKKAQLIEAAKQCVIENGIESLTFRSLAAKANVSQGTIYHHFQSKERLMIEIIENISETSWEELGSISNSKQLINDALSSALSRQQGNSSFHQLFLSLVVMSLHNKQMKNKISNLIKIENDNLSNILHKLDKDQWIEGISHEHLAILLNSLIDGLAIQSLIVEDFPTEEIFESLYKLFSLLMNIKGD